MRSEEMIKLLPSGLREVLQKMNLDVAGLQEIRLRAEQRAPGIPQAAAVHRHRRLRPPRL